MPRAAAPHALAPPSLEAAARDPARSGAQAMTLRQEARRGLSGASVPFPHGDRIRQAFGRYAPAGLRAHMGPATMAAAGRMNAAAFVLDGRAAFAGRPSLHTAAHEAVHLAHHERGGAALRHGVGAPGDRHEALADRVADAVAAGRSAEPLLAASLPSATGPAGPMLQMKENDWAANSHTPTAPSKTPWKEIQDALPFKDANFVSKQVKALSDPYKKMVGALGDACFRSETAVADLYGQRPTGARGSDPTQTAYGNLGKFEAELNGVTPPKGQHFEGGHLISDQILGPKSYEQWNFAPQVRDLNSPIYREIEKIGSGGLKRKVALPKGTKKPPATAYEMSVRLSYPANTYSVDTADIEALLKYAPGGLNSPYTANTIIPDSVSITPRVPITWAAKTTTASTDHVFAYQATIKPQGRMHDAFMTGENNVAALLPPNGADYTQPLKWSMNTMTAPKPNKKKKLGTQEASEHTYYSIQPVHRRPPKPPPVQPSQQTQSVSVGGPQLGGLPQPSTGLGGFGLGGLGGSLGGGFNFGGPPSSGPVFGQSTFNFGASSTPPIFGQSPLLMPPLNLPPQGLVVKKPPSAMFSPSVAKKSKPKPPPKKKAVKQVNQASTPKNPQPKKKVKLTV